MKTSTLILYILGMGLLFTIIITPFEALWSNQDINWMYQLNLKEYWIFMFSFLGGIITGTKTNILQL